MANRDPIRLVLYIKGNGSSSERALRIVRQAVSNRDDVVLQVRDIAVEPLRDGDELIVVTPTLIRCSAPRTVHVGDLRNVPWVREAFIDVPL